MLERPTSVGRFYLTMDHPHEPLDVIEKWQQWYKKNRVVAELDEPLVSKQSREKLHDTTNAVPTISAAMNNTATEKLKKQAQDYFADTLAEFANELSGKDLYEALVAAVNYNLEVVKKEYEQAKEFADLVQGTGYGTK
jgi:hypothetical protein